MVVLNAHSETSTPLISCVIGDALLRAIDTELLLNLNAHIVVFLVQIWALEPQDWWSERGCLPIHNFEMRDTDTEAVCTHSADIVSLEDKELTTDLAHDRQLLFSQNHVTVIRVRQYELH